MSSDRIFTVRRLAPAELPGRQENLEVRSPHLRLALRTGWNVTTDYALVNRAAPYATQLERPQIMVALAGRARIEEQGRREWLGEGGLCAMEGGVLRDGTAAYGGSSSRQLIVEWDPEVYGARYDRQFETTAVSAVDRERLEAAASRAISPATSDEGTRDVLAILRSIGVPFERVDVPASAEVSPALVEVSAALESTLSSLESSPVLEDLVDELGWNTRRLHRSIKSLAERFVMPWHDWRSALHAHRMLAATQLLSVRGATTELVARLTGFRSPSSLCHAFANAGLPSPGTLARAARDSAMEGWADAA